MTSAFSTNDTECLNRETEHNIHAAANFDQIWDKQRQNECVQFIDSHQFNKVSIPFCLFSPFEFRSNPFKALLWFSFRKIG